LISALAQQAREPLKCAYIESCNRSKAGEKLTSSTRRFFCFKPIRRAATLSVIAVFPHIERLEGVLQEVTPGGSKSMESIVNPEVRELCRAVSQEQDSERLKRLLDELLTVLDERQLLASLL
jgi:hypothetical protein